MSKFALEITRRLRLVIPDGSMQKVILTLLARAGFSLPEIGSRQKKILLDSPIIESITLMRPQMSPMYVELKYFDLIIVGKDHIVNTGAKLKILFEMAVARQTKQAVRIVLAVAKDSGYRSVADLPFNCVIATEYVEMVKRYLRKNKRCDIKVIRSFGGTEHMIAYGAAAIVDVTETGSSLVANGLVIIDELMTSNTVLAVNQQVYDDPDLRPVVDWFVSLVKGSWDADQFVRMDANVSEGLAKEAIEIIGGMKAPTLSPLSIPGWVAVTSYIPKERQHEISFLLNQLGVKDICIQAVDITMGID